MGTNVDEMVMNEEVETIELEPSKQVNWGAAGLVATGACLIISGGVIAYKKWIKPGIRKLKEKRARKAAENGEDSTFTLGKDKFKTFNGVFDEDQK